MKPAAKKKKEEEERPTSPKTKGKPAPVEKEEKEEAAEDDADEVDVGAEAAYNVTEGRVSRYALAAGFNAPEYAVTLHALNDLKSFSASYYHRVSADVEAGAKAVYDPKLTSGGVSIEVGTKTYLDSAAFVKAKINNSGVLALGYTQSLRPGLKASFGLALDTQKLNEVDPTGPVHKVGMSFVFES